MMRLPLFEFRSPRTIAEAARILDGEGKNVMALAGGTDLLPNMKRRQQVPRTLMSLRNIEGLREIHFDDSELKLGACVTLTEIAADRRLRSEHSAIWQAAAQVATPHIRNVATLGGNICLDTRCNYYDQSYEWRKAINFCMKKDGDRCWVALSSPKCVAVSSTDTAPALIALGARVTLVSHSGRREILLADLFNNDGMNYLTRRPDEILTEVHLGTRKNWRSTYWKLRRRGSFDFPVLSVAAAVRLAYDGIVEDARIVIGSVGPRPLVAIDAANSLIDQRLTQESIEQAAILAAGIARPLDNTDFDMTWRKKVAVEFVTYALRELRGDDMRGERESLTRHAPL
jgi:4-hydroxybenzoyl-CoA reductase subunit beta